MHVHFGQRRLCSQNSNSGRDVEAVNMASTRGGALIIFFLLEEMGPETKKRSGFEFSTGIRKMYRQRCLKLDPQKDVCCTHSVLQSLRCIFATPPAEQKFVVLTFAASRFPPHYQTS